MITSRIMIDESIFQEGKLPRLLYANRQEFGLEKHDRPLHKHESLCELLLCYQGRGIYHVNNERLFIQEGDLLYYNVGEFHEVVSLEDCEIGTYCFGFCELRLNGLPLNHMIGAGYSHIRPSGSRFSVIREMAEQILESRMEDPEGRAISQILGVGLLMLAISAKEIKGYGHNETLLSGPGASASASTEREVVSKVKEYIAAHYTENISIDEIANALSFSPSYISHSFKAGTGYSPLEYAIRCRIGLSQTLLISSDMSVTAIAGAVGYNNSNYFQTQFRKIVGLSPLSYRKMYLKSLRGERNQE